MKLKNLAAGLCLWATVFPSFSRADALDDDFASPPTPAKPYVWWHWMGSNINEAGIDKDLAAMKEMGVAGATICCVGSTTGIGNTKVANSPWPDVQFLSPRWWELMQRAVQKGGELGLEMGMHNCAGWSASGGPWITPELSMQKLVWTETKLTGPAHFADKLPRSKVDPKFNFYHDVTVLAVPGDGNVNVGDVREISAQMNSDGILAWDVPEGTWSVYRIGHTTTGKTPHPMPDGFEGLECDKMSVEAATVHMRNVIDPLNVYLGGQVGKAFGHILFDSYEAGPQNWTEDFRQQFQQLRGYDPVPWLPVFAGKKIGGDALTKRFQADMARTITDLYTINDAAVFHRMLKDVNVRMCFEPYKGFNTIDASAECDTVMGEFWTRNNNGIGRAVTAAAQGLGGNIVGAEAFTGDPPSSQWTETPATLKPCADGAMISGVNQFYLHDWTLQPFDDSIKPGIAMGWWGTQFGRNETWFEQGKVFFTYLAKCSAVLQRGHVVSDFCTVETALPGGDALSMALLLSSHVENGQIVTTAGRQYPLLVLPDGTEMLPEIAEKVKQLIGDGARVLGPRPKSSPSLSDYPNCDKRVAGIAGEVWGDSAEASGERSFGKGTIFWGQSASDVLKAIHLDADFIVKSAETSDVHSIHRRDGQTDIYFVANLGKSEVNLSGSFRVSGKIPEIWSPAEGTKEDAGVWTQADGRTEVPLVLGPTHSVFVIFRRPVGGTNSIASVASSDSTSTTQPILRGGRSGEVRLKTAEAGEYQIKLASGKSQTVEVAALPAKIEITGAWNVKFIKGFGATQPLKMDELTAWNSSSDPALRYFSGTASYTKEFQMDGGQYHPDRREILDLGRVESIVTVIVNNHLCGILWYPPYQIDVTNALRPGTNHLELRVTNTWRNQLIGDEQQPSDLEWGAVQNFKPTNPQGRPPAKFPEWIVQGKPRPSTGRLTFTTWNYFDKNSKLEDSGLLGPVSVNFVGDVVVSSKEGASVTQPSSAISRSEFIFDSAPFPSCHASTIAETKRGLVTAFFGGTRERAPDVGIWISHNEGQGWSPLVEVANGIQATGPRQPTWNPVLFQVTDGPLLLFYKVGPSPALWWGMMMSSDDGGKTWSKSVRLPDGILGPIKDKPIEGKDGTLICPSSTEGEGGWRCHMEFTKDLGATWTKSDFIGDGKTVRIVQPTLLDHGPGGMQFLCRSREGNIFESWSSDAGRTWSAPEPTDLPNPNSGIDAVQLRDGRSLLVYNPSATDRYPVSLAISADGKTWKPAGLIEQSDDGGQLSYPAIIQTSDGLVHITYTWKRKNIRHVVLDPGKLP